MLAEVDGLRELSALEKKRKKKKAPSRSRSTG
jgi:hypothetical protein